MNSGDIVKRNTAHVKGKAMVMPGTPEMPAVKYEVDKHPHTVEAIPEINLEVTMVMIGISVIEHFTSQYGMMQLN
jgi:hypothetical protein